MKQISILGCGWLGFPLARILTQNGYGIKGSTTSESKIGILRDAGIKPFCIQLSPVAVIGEIADFLSSEVLIVNIPPKISEGLFTEKLKALLPHLERSTIRKVLFVSSISVYGETAGVVDETEIPQPDSDNGRQLLAAEKMLRDNSNFQTTVLRFGGLIGEDRHPVRHLSGKQNENPDARVNLIHADDCVGIIRKIISRRKWGEIYNAVSPFHPTRREYYSQKATEMNLPLPDFAQGGNNGKIVCADKIVADLDYVFEKPFL